MIYPDRHSIRNRTPGATTSPPLPGGGQHRGGQKGGVGNAFASSSSLGGAIRRRGKGGLLCF